MAVTNDRALLGWNADSVSGTSISISIANKVNFTTDDAAAPAHSYSTQTVQVLTFNATKTVTRVTDLSATVADDEFRIVTGQADSSGGLLPQVFRKTWALTRGTTLDADDLFELADTAMIWTAQPFTYTIDTTYTGPGSPTPNPDHFDGSGTGDLEVTFDRANPDQLTWVVSAPINGFGATFTVDPVTLKKSGSDNFGFTDTITMSNPGTVGGVPVTAWDVVSTITITVS